MIYQLSAWEIILCSIMSCVRSPPPTPSIHSIFLSLSLQLFQVDSNFGFDSIQLYVCLRTRARAHASSIYFVLSIVRAHLFSHLPLFIVHIVEKKQNKYVYVFVNALMCTLAQRPTRTFQASNEMKEKK